MSLIFDIVRDIVHNNNDNDSNSNNSNSDIKCSCECKLSNENLGFYTIGIVSLVFICIVLFLVNFIGVISERNVGLTKDLNDAYDTVATQQDRIAELTLRLDKLRKGLTSHPDEDTVDSLEHEKRSRCAFWNSDPDLQSESDSA